MRVLLGALCLALSSASLADSLVINNVNGYTLTEQGVHRFGALHIDDGKVVVTAARDGFNGLSPDRIIDGKGHTLLPGLTDAHGHIMGLGYLQSDLDLSGITSKQAALERVRQFADAHPHLTWIRGRGWNQELWPDTAFPTASDLDTVVPERPVWLRRVDGHAGWGNSQALTLARITPTTPDPEGGQLLRNADGSPTGILIDNAMGLVEGRLPPREPHETEAAFRSATRKLASLGLTGVHDAGVNHQTLQMYQMWDQQQQLPIRIYAMVSDLDTLSRMPGPYFGDRLIARSVKLYADGALGSRGAALLDDYSDMKGHRGLLIHPIKELKRRIKGVINRGFQANVHAIGDRGNREVLEAMIAYGKPEQRNRIEHLQVVEPSDFDRIKAAGIVASMQPTHATSDMNMAEDRLGSLRIHGAYAWKTVINKGIPFAAGSDFPIESPNPFWGLYSAVSRQDHQGHPEGGWYPRQSLSREQALHGFTLGAAYASFQENELGSLDPGKRADFILIDRDYFTVPVEQIWQTQVLATYIDGQPVYQQSDL